MAFLIAEMGTSRSLDGHQRLMVKGWLAPKTFEGILNHYFIWVCTSALGFPVPNNRPPVEFLLFWRWFFICFLPWSLDLEFLFFFSCPNMGCFSKVN
ncbi:hypothetical protein ACS0TY_011521 [Phlomoides rotata]